MQMVYFVAPIPLAVFFFNITINPGSAVVFQPESHSKYLLESHDGVYKLLSIENGRKLYYHQERAAIPFLDALRVVEEYLAPRDKSITFMMALKVIETDLIQLALRMSIDHPETVPMVLCRSEMGIWRNGRFHWEPLGEQNVVMNVVEGPPKTDLDLEFRNAGFVKDSVHSFAMECRFGNRDATTHCNHADHEDLIKH